MSYIVDTDWVIDGIGQLPGALATLEQLSPQGLAVSVVTIGEVFEGAYIFPDPAMKLAGYRRFLSGYQILPVTERIMAQFAASRAELRRQGALFRTWIWSLPPRPCIMD